MSYNLLDEPWIPALYRDGHFKRVGIRAALTEAGRIRQIAASNPMDNVALLQFLLAVLIWCKEDAKSAPSALDEKSDGIPENWLAKLQGVTESTCADLEHRATYDVVVLESVQALLKHCESIRVMPNADAAATKLADLPAPLPQARQAGLTKNCADKLHGLVKASTSNGDSKLIKEIDISLGLDHRHPSKINALAEKLSLKALPEDVEPFVKKTSVLLLLHPESGIRVDFVFSSTPYEKRLLSELKLWQ